MTTLYINTKDRKTISVALKKEGKIMENLSEENEYGSQALLPLILRLLRTTNSLPAIAALPGRLAMLGMRAGRRLQAGELITLQGIEVETGPGSFTGLRVGVSVANALGFTLGIPVNNKKIETELSY